MAKFTEDQVKQMIASAVAEALKGTTAPKPAAKSTKQLPDTLEVPESQEHRRMFLGIVAAAQKSIDDGFSPLVPGWILQRDGVFPPGQSDLNRKLALELEMGGFIRILPSKKGGFLYLPVVLDDGKGRAARSAKGTHAADMKRSVDALESRYARQIDAAGIGQTRTA